jgi:subtilisin family serine protease
VGASNSSDARASFSSHGPALDITAPGSGAINSPTWTVDDATSLYTQTLYGTSYASPLVASLASLIKSIRPDSSPEDITALILATARQPSDMDGALYTNMHGHGIVDAHRALTVATSLNATEELPLLYQAGSSRSEHSYNSSQILGSGCVTQTPDTYCTVWLQKDGMLYDRYLPYTKTSDSAHADWSWNTGLLGIGSWQTRAVQGDAITNPYPLSRK